MLCQSKNIAVWTSHRYNCINHSSHAPPMKWMKHSPSYFLSKKREIIYKLNDNISLCSEMFHEVKIWNDIITHLVLIWNTGSHHTSNLFHRLNFIDGQIDGFCSRRSPLNYAKVLQFHSHIHQNPFNTRHLQKMDSLQALQSSQNWRHSLCWLSRILHHSHKQIMFCGSVSTTVFYWKPWVYKISWNWARNNNQLFFQ